VGLTGCTIAALATGDAFERTFMRQPIPVASASVSALARTQRDARDRSLWGPFDTADDVGMLVVMFKRGIAPAGESIPEITGSVSLAPLGRGSPAASRTLSGMLTYAADAAGAVDTRALSKALASR
jgi:hypothetical protein